MHSSAPQWFCFAAAQAKLTRAPTPLRNPSNLGCAKVATASGNVTEMAVCRSSLPMQLSKRSLQQRWSQRRQAHQIGLHHHQTNQHLAASTVALEVEVTKTPIAAPVENAWTIQWAALSTAAAARQYGIKYLADSAADYEIRPIRVNNRDYYILFSGRYPSKAAATEAAEQIRTASSEAPFFRTMSSIRAAARN